MSEHSDEPIERPAAGDSIFRHDYDPAIPDEIPLHEHEAEDPEFTTSTEGRAAAADTMRGEELRPKDGSLDPSSAR